VGENGHGTSFIIAYGRRDIGHIPAAAALDDGANVIERSLWVREHGWRTGQWCQRDDHMLYFRRQ